MKKLSLILAAAALLAANSWAEKPVEKCSDYEIKENGDIYKGGKHVEPSKGGKGGVNDMLNDLTGGGVAACGEFDKIKGAKEFKAKQNKQHQPTKK